MSTMPVRGLVSIRTWFLMIDSSSLIRASIMPCSFFAAWHWNSWERSPTPRAALILATIAGRRPVVGWSSSLRTATRPSGVMWTSLVIYWSLVRRNGTSPPRSPGRSARSAGWGDALSYIVAKNAKTPADRRNAAHGYGAGGRRRGFPGRDLPSSARPGGRHPRVGSRSRAWNRPDDRRRQPRRQHRLGPGGHPLRVRCAGVRGGVLLPVACPIPHRPRLLPPPLSPSPPPPLPPAPTTPPRPAPPAPAPPPEPPRPYRKTPPPAQTPP